MKTIIFTLSATILVLTLLLVKNNKVEPEVVELPTQPLYAITMDESCYQQLLNSDKVQLIIRNENFNE